MVRSLLLGILASELILVVGCGNNDYTSADFWEEF